MGERGDLRGDRAHARLRRPRGRRRHHGGARTRVRGRGGEHRGERACPGSLVGGHATVHHTGLPVSGERCAADQLPSARVDTAHAGVRLRRLPPGARRLRARAAGAVSVLQLRGRHAGHAGARLRPTFTVQASDGAARAGRLVTAHGVVETPAFMPVGTYGTVKAMTPEELAGLGTQIILGNTFHLMLRPGAGIVAAHGGLHRFMHWQYPLLTDSGGFPVYSLQSLRGITEEGVRFRSPLDGAEVRLSPEDSMDVQLALRSDIAMALDDCTEHPATESAARESMERSMRWAARSHAHYHRAEEHTSELQSQSNLVCRLLLE